MRQRKKKWASNELNTNKKVVLTPKNYKSKWKTYFDNNNEIYLEIGSGKGKFITENARVYKDKNFIALERDPNVICVAVRNADKDLNNLAFIVGDVQNLQDYFDENELSRLYINFCDPWDRKRKWAKRRLTYYTFLETYKKLLSNNGEVHFKTDNKNLFEFSLNQFCNQDFKLKNITFDLHNSDIQNNIMTEYETKFSEKGQNIFRLEAISKK